jgi:hypothetical protein
MNIGGQVGVEAGRSPMRMLRSCKACIAAARSAGIVPASPSAMPTSINDAAFQLDCAVDAILGMVRERIASHDAVAARAAVLEAMRDPSVQRIIVAVASGPSGRPVA